MMKRHSQTGAGLLTAMILLMLITSIISTVVVVTHYDIRRHRQLRHMETAQAMIDGATRLALNALTEDAQDNTIDSRQDPWAIPLPAYPVDGGYVRGSILPLSSRFNLYTLTLPNDDQRAEYVALLRRICASLDLPDRHATAIVDAMRTGATVTPMDLLLQLGFDDASIDTLLPWLHYYPVLDGFNVNLLDRDMWQLLTGMDAVRAEQLVNELTQTPVNDANAFINKRFGNRPALKNLRFTTETRFFDVQVEVKIGEITRVSTVRVFRMGKGGVHILHRTIDY